MLEVIEGKRTYVKVGKIHANCMRCQSVVYYDPPRRQAIVLCSQCHAIEYTLFRQQQKEEDNATNTSID